MRVIKEVYDRIYQIESEPGDMTHYSYIMVIGYSDKFRFIPYNNTFYYPTELDYWSVKDLDEEEINQVAADLNCNPYTLKECIAAMNEVIDNNL